MNSEAIIPETKEIEQINPQPVPKEVHPQMIFTFETIKNTGNLQIMKKLIDLKNIFAKQLPKMPKEYISRLMFDRKHESIAIKDKNGKIFGGICYRVFEPVKLAEIVFLAVMSERQIKGFGTKIMNELKTQMQVRGIRFLMTCADNLAIGYFQKQGFHKDLLMPSVLYKGYLKDYEGSTLMECLLHKSVNYREVFQSIRNRKKELISMVEGMVNNHQVYPSLPQEAFFLKKILAEASKLEEIFNFSEENSKINLPESCKISKRELFEKIKHIPGLEKTSFDFQELEDLLDLPRGSDFQSSCLHILERLVEFKSSWPFLQSVKKEEVPDYYDVVKNPMDFHTMREKVLAGDYKNREQYIEDVQLICDNARIYNTKNTIYYKCCLLYTSPSPRDLSTSRMPSSA